MINVLSVNEVLCAPFIANGLPSFWAGRLATIPQEVIDAVPSRIVLSSLRNLDDACYHLAMELKHDPIGWAFACGNELMERGFSELPRHCLVIVDNVGCLASGLEAFFALSGNLVCDSLTNHDIGRQFLPLATHIPDKPYIRNCYCTGCAEDYPSCVNFTEYRRWISTPEKRGVDVHVTRAERKEVLTKLAQCSVGRN